MVLSIEERLAEIDSLNTEFVAFIKNKKFKFSKSIFYYRLAIHETTQTMKKYAREGELTDKETIHDTFKVCVAISLTRFENLKRINSIEDLLGRL